MTDDRPAWYPEGYPYPPVRVSSSRRPFPVGETLTLYEAARIISGRHPYPLLDDGRTTLGPDMGLISGGSTGLTRRRHRPLRAKEAFEILQQKVMSGGIHAEMCRFAQPGVISDGGIDWLNVKVHTADVVHLCEEQGWRCGLRREPLTAPVPRKSPEDILNLLIELEIQPGRHKEWPWKRVQSEMAKAAGNELAKGLSPRNIQRQYKKLVAGRRKGKARR